MEGPRCANSRLRPHSQVVGKVLHAPIVQRTVQSTLPIVQHWFDKWSLEENCPTGMRRGLSLTRRSKMTCVRTNEWWVAKAWTVGTLTIWASFLRLFAQLAAHEFWKWCCEFSFSATFSMGEISKKMRDGWTNAAGDYMASTSSSNNAQHTLARWIEFALQCSKA